ILVHVVDISHPNFEEQIEVVTQTLRDVCGGDEKPTILVFNKVDAFTYTPKDADDLTPVKRENISLDELKASWMAKLNDNCVFISAKTGKNIDELKRKLYDMAKEIHLARFPYNDLLYQQYDDIDTSVEE
ncbi:MAG: GTPase HflX, partial [Muribaculaceae bacterium]|nr:GTPase HflX [Muribaculaceae bacterium]